MCVLGVDTTSQEGAFQVAARRIEQAVKARIVAQKVVYGERYDVFSGTSVLAVARALSALASSSNL